MEALDIARRLAELGETKDAQEAYITALQQNDGADPKLDLEASLYLFHTQYDYRVPYTIFQRLYNAGHFQDALLDIMTQAFYAPNYKNIQRRYERNCRLLARYPYVFRKDFPAFDELTVKYFPYDDNGYLPFDIEKKRFEDYVAPAHQIISQNFFHDLSKPVLASDVYSQYELEYLNDMVRRSEWCAKENHIYLHYNDWEKFCCFLQIVDFRKLLEDKKFVFLIEDERSLYPIDFKEKYGIDYSQNPVKPFGIREVNKLIWHTQFQFHNGGDFFNEVFHGHPNLLAEDSIMTDSILSGISEIRNNLKIAGKDQEIIKKLAAVYSLSPTILRNISMIRDLTDKDVLVGIFLGNPAVNRSLDMASRIVPALFLQPHMSQIKYSLELRKDRCVLDSDEARKLLGSGLLQSFKYVKTFTPVRRPTTSYAASNRFMWATAAQAQYKEDDTTIVVMVDNIAPTLLNRSYMADWQDRLFMDSRLVRFEDGKLNPKATFTELAAFLDLPYTESMTECTGIISPGNAVGFDPVSVYRTYDEYTSDGERYFLECFLHDMYRYCGYDFQYYDGAPMDAERIQEMIDSFDRWKESIIVRAEEGFINLFIAKPLNGIYPKREELEKPAHLFALGQYEQAHDYLSTVSNMLLKGLQFINRNLQPLRFMELIHPNPALLDQPLYH